MLMTVTVPVAPSLSAEACAAMREAGLMDEQGNLGRALVEQALADCRYDRRSRQGPHGVAARGRWQG